MNAQVSVNRAVHAMNAVHNPDSMTAPEDPEAYIREQITAALEDLRAASAQGELRLD